MKKRKQWYSDVGNIGLAFSYIGYRSFFFPPTIFELYRATALRWPTAKLAFSNDPHSFDFIDVRQRALFIGSSHEIRIHGKYTPFIRFGRVYGYFNFSRSQKNRDEYVENKLYTRRVFIPGADLSCIINFSLCVQSRVDSL